MEEVKKVPEIRFGGFENSNELWKKHSLGELATIVRGASPRPINDPKWFDKTSEIGWLRISDVTAQDGKIKFLSQRISEAGQEKTRVLLEQHLLLSIAASVGKPVLNYVKTGVHDGFLIFLNPEFELNFMFHWLKMFEPKWQIYGQPGSQVNLNSDIVKNHKIFIPDRNEQKRIGVFFDNIDKQIKNHNTSLKKLTQLKKAMLIKMFPQDGATTPAIRFKGFDGEWEVKQIQSIANRYDNLRIPVKASDRKIGKTPYYGANGIQGYVDGYTHKGEFVLIAEDGANDLKNYPIKYVEGEIWVNNHAHVIQGIDNIADNFFLSYTLKTVNIEPFLVGGGRAKLNAEIMMEIEISLPSDINEQQKIGNYFKNLDNLIDHHSTQLNKLNQIKKACLSKLFVQ